MLCLQGFCRGSGDMFFASFLMLWRPARVKTTQTAPRLGLQTPPKQKHLKTPLCLTRLQLKVVPQIALHQGLSDPIRLKQLGVSICPYVQTSTDDTLNKMVPLEKKTFEQKGRRKNIDESHPRNSEHNTIKPLEHLHTINHH